MNKNGMVVQHRPMHEAEAQAFLRAQAEERLRVFGAERLDAVGEKPPAREVMALAQQIETVCSDSQARTFRGRSTRSIQAATHTLHARWNPAGIIGGFSDSDGGTLASVNGIHNETYWEYPPGRLLPRRLRALEGLGISHDGQATIVRSIEPANKPGCTISSAGKPATADELRAVHATLQTAYAAERIQNVLHSRLPLYVEVGSGLDPMSLRGARSFVTKSCVEIDKADGDYENPYGEYGTAVQAQSARFASQAGAERPGEHISFILGDGTAMPLPDSSTHELFMSNVLNAPIGDEARHGLLLEARRVSEPSGTMVVRANWHTDTWPPEKMAGLVGDYFYVPRVVPPDDPAYAMLETQYGAPVDVPAPEGYYLIATDPKR
jgi:hypothetical protein